MVKKMPFRYNPRKTVTNETLDYVKLPQVPDGEIWCCQGIAYENETGARGTFRRYIDRGGVPIFLTEHQSPELAELIFTDKIVYLLPGEILTIRQASCTIGDKLALYVHGYKIHSQFIDD